jgi:O-acetyl-ADP-ribose deacetylase (regulator of RNase III)
MLVESVRRVSPKIVLRLLLGDIAAWAGAPGLGDAPRALATSANVYLEGNTRLKNWWGYAGKRNVDGAIHLKAGPELAQACRALPAVRGERCPHGTTQVTPGFGTGVEHILHTALPSFALAEAREGARTSSPSPPLSLADEALNSLASGSFGIGWEAATTTGTATALDGLKTFTLPPARQYFGSDPESEVPPQELAPEPTLVAAYKGLFTTARALGVHSLALPALGCGALVFPPDLVARIAVGEALAHAVHTHAHTRSHTHTRTQTHTHTCTHTHTHTHTYIQT